MKPWCCSHGHIMGQVVRNGRGIRKLILYREAIDGQAAMPAMVDVMAVVEGYVAEIRCSVCDSVRTWIPGEESMKHLLSQAKKMHLAIEQK
jgi:hypothetical protein